MTTSVSGTQTMVVSGYGRIDWPEPRLSRSLRLLPSRVEEDSMVNGLTDDPTGTACHCRRAADVG
jgi:hypothetical protein